MIPGSTQDDGPAQSRLIAAGFNDLRQTRAWLSSPELEGLDQETLFRQISGVANPDQALLLLIRLIERTPGVRDLVAEAEAETLLALLGGSEALGEFLVRRPEHLDLFLNPEQATATAPALEKLTTPQDSTEAPETLRALLLESVGADPNSDQPQASYSGKDAAVALRCAYRRQLVAIAAKDLTSTDPEALQPVVSVWLADLASAAMEAALAVARAVVAERVGQDTQAQVDLAVMGMGKCGARELNYLSDVDVIYVHDVTTELVEANDTVEIEPVTADEGAEIAIELATELAQVIQGPAPEPPLWEVDAGLRPEGADGALSRTVASHEKYYRRWAHTWEFQALLKARRIAGSESLAQQYLDALSPMVWDASTRDGFVTQLQNMRGRVIANIKPQDRERELKLGPGGLRDVEFPAQLLQLVHGKTDPNLRVRGTEEALEALSVGGYISHLDADELIADYRFLRTMEHRIQLVQLRRTHLMPEKPDQLRCLARAMTPHGGKPGDADAMVRRWKKTTREVRQKFERIFYRPLLPSTAALSADEVRLSPEAAQLRLSALGYNDPHGALRHISHLTEGVSRAAALQRQLLPAMLGWFAQGPDPDGGLLGFRKLSESLSRSPRYLGMLRDSSDAAERLCRVLSTSRYIAEMLEYVPNAVRWLDSDKDLEPLGLDTLVTEMRSLAKRHQDEPMTAIRHVRMIRRREILRTAMADASQIIDQPAIGVALSNADQATVIVALDIITTDIVKNGNELLCDIAVIAMGRQGGQEIGYGSDLDVMFVHQPRPGVSDDAAARQAVDIAKRLTQLVKGPVRPALPFEQVLMIDADLRPEGKRGPLVRSLNSYQTYYKQWADLWEIQALLRARPIAGPEELQQAFITWADSLRYHTGMDAKQLKEIQRIKARVESERLPRGADPRRHVKLGRGGLTDVEWLVQTRQLEYAAEHEELRTTSTLPALHALAELELLDPEDAEVLADAWSMATAIRSAAVITTAKAADSLPTNRDKLDMIARWMGYGPGEAGELEEDYLRLTRQARAVFEEEFYGVTETT